MHMNSIDKPIKKLLDIENNLIKYENLSREEIFDSCVKDKLKATLILYNIETDDLTDFLSKQAAIRVLKAATKIKKFSDKEIIAQHMEER